MPKIRITDADGAQHDVPMPLKIDALDDKPDKPEKKLIDLYWSQAEKYLKHNLDYGLKTLQRTDIDPEQFARLALGEHHDAPWVFFWLGQYFHTHAIEYSRTILDLVTPYIVGQGKGMPGYHCYNRGAIAAGRPDIARNIADLSNYSSTKHQTPKNTNWKTYAAPGASHARDFSLATIAHLLWQDDMKERGKHEYDHLRDDYIINVRQFILIENARWHVYAGRNETDDELASTWRLNWYPYIITHLCRALIELDVRNRLQVDYALIPDLCEVMWDRAYREAHGRHGLAYQMDRTDPAPDLSLHTMPCYAYAWHLTGEKVHRERALKLLESGLKWAYLAGHRQFCQSYMWSRQGLGWLFDSHD